MVLVRRGAQSVDARPGGTRSDGRVAQQGTSGSLGGVATLTPGAVDGSGPGASGSVPGTESAAAGLRGVTFLPLEDVSAPESYRADVRVDAFDPATGVASIRILGAELMGPIDPATGEEMRTATADERKAAHVGQIQGLDLVAGVSMDVRETLAGPGVFAMVVVLMPAEGGATVLIESMR